VYLKVVINWRLSCIINTGKIMAFVLPTGLETVLAESDATI
jgi:hypothetical protein